MALFWDKALAPFEMYARRACRTSLCCNPVIIVRRRLRLNPRNRKTATSPSLSFAARVSRHERIAPRRNHSAVWESCPTECHSARPRKDPPRNYHLTKAMESLVQTDVSVPSQSQMERAQSSISVMRRSNPQATSGTSLSMRERFCNVSSMFRPRRCRCGRCFDTPLR